ncbi:hypothetical protein PG987_001183 [Apiospora arundinis]
MSPLSRSSTSDNLIHHSQRHQLNQRNPVTAIINMSSDNNTTTNNDNKQNAGTMTTQDASRIQSAERAARRSRGRAVPLSPRAQDYDGPSSSSSSATPTPYTTTTRDSTADKSSTPSSSAQAKSGTGGNLADTFAARAQSAAAKNEDEQDKGKGKDTKGCCIDNPEHAIVDSP